MKTYEITLRFAVDADARDAFEAAEAFAHELVAEAREHLIGDEVVEVAAVKPVATSD